MLSLTSFEIKVTVFQLRYSRLSLKWSIGEQYALCLEVNKVNKAGSLILPLQQQQRTTILFF